MPKETQKNPSVISLSSSFVLGHNCKQHCNEHTTQSHEQSEQHLLVVGITVDPIL
jgi:hypothetical protein